MCYNLTRRMVVRFGVLRVYIVGSYGFVGVFGCFWLLLYYCLQLQDGNAKLLSKGRLCLKTLQGLLAY